MFDDLNIVEPKAIQIPMHEMRPGQAGELVKDGERVICLGIVSGKNGDHIPLIHSLTKESRTWTGGDGNMVRLFPPGTVLQLILKC